MSSGNLSPVYAFRSAPSMIDYPGHLSGVMFTTGCNFRCGFCHNAPLLAEKRDGMPWTRLATQCRSWQDDWVNGVVVTGGEPTLCDDLQKLLVFLRQYGFSIKLDTNGSRPDVLRDCMELVDYVAMDIKTGLSMYPELTGYPHADRIADSIEIIRVQARDYEFRTTVIEHLHGKAQMSEIADMIRGATRYVMQPFVPRDGLLDARFEQVPRTPPHRMEALAAHVRPAVQELALKT